MKIGIVSDIHDHLAKLRAALERLQGAAALLCCGDICSPFALREMGRGFPGPIHVVWGNNDGDLYRLTEVSQQMPHIRVHGELAQLELEGVRVGMVHYDDVGRLMAGGGQFDLVCFGHNHRFELGRAGRTLIINPGEACGWLTGQSTCALLDTATGQSQRLDL
ncbi:MAG TPA: metallophosphoesterase [Candidatus Paceibacterota bacterium]|nr:metallophosphoesterase [Verrucomicrobiota bacterium]HOX03110.1 metallophosphoesterase [Verrucomicrobiota bacterium]HRZ44740.1 metallophosphoesterase [Candidatus Paceibacterota bacterium]HRZ91446.1 metallophosphoesterase [Candidatus Paceibacterota bacterium]